MAQRIVRFEGKTYKFPEDATDQEIESALSGGSTRTMEPPPLPKPPVPDALQATPLQRSLAGVSTGDAPVIQNVGDFLSGAAQSGASLVENVKTLLGQEGKPMFAQLPGMGYRTIPAPTEQQLTPQNPMQAMGKTATDIAQVVLPGAAVSRMTKGMGVVPRVAAEAATTGGMSLAQGASPEQALGNAVVAGAIPAAGSAWYSAKDFINRKITPRMLNSLMEVNPKWLEFGRDPGGRVIKEGLIAGSKDGLLMKVDDQLKDAGLALNAKLTKDGAGKILNGEDIVLNAVTNATKKIGRRTDPAFQAALERTMTETIEKVPDIKRMTPLQAHELKQKLGDAVSWNGAAYEDDINSVLLEMYRGLNNMIEGALPGAKQLQARWGDLHVAQKALKQSIQKDMTRPLASGQGLLANVNKVVGTTPAKTGAAQMLKMHGPQGTVSDPMQRIWEGIVGAQN